MGKLDITYLGINLKNPLIVGASNMVNNIDNIKELEDAGAAAIVYKSLFEEQIQLENLERQQVQDEAMDRHAEMISPFPNMEDAEANEHLFKLKKVKESINIPVFASLNAVYKESWSDYAKQIEDTGVDGLELNFFAVPRDSELSGAEIEKQQIEVLNTVRKSVDIPIAIKLSPFYANPINLIQKLDKSGAQGFVLFNRMFQPDIDIENEEHITDFHLSCEHNNKLPLRFAGLLHGNINSNICSNNGIYTTEDVIKMILAGADCVQIVSTIYKNKSGIIKEIIEGLKTWMDKKQYNTINDFQGKLSNQQLNDPFIYKRAQYVDMLMKKSEEVIKKYPLI